MGFGKFFAWFLLSCLIIFICCLAVVGILWPEFWPWYITRITTSAAETEAAEQTAREVEIQKGPYLLPDGTPSVRMYRDAFEIVRGLEALDAEERRELNERLDKSTQGSRPYPDYSGADQARESWEHHLRGLPPQTAPRMEPTDG